jgi:hypothetical protein
MIVFAILYIAGLNIFICLVIIFSAGTALFTYVNKMSRRYGQYGLMKKIVRRGIPKVIKSYSEPLAVKVLTDYINQLPYPELVATFREALSAIIFNRKSQT